MVSYLVMCDISKTVCAFGEEGGERTKNRHFARNCPEESNKTTQTLYWLLGSCFWVVGAAQVLDAGKKWN